MGNDLIGQYSPGTSLLHRLDARAKLINLLLLAISLVLIKNVIGYFWICGLLVLLYHYGGISVRPALSSMKKLSGFFLLILFMNAFFFSTQDALWQWWIFHLTREGVWHGIQVIFCICPLMLLSNLLLQTTKPMEITSAISRLLKPLALFHLPSQEIAMILSVAVQFIPILSKEADTIKKAQIARGARFDSKHLADRARSYLPLVVPVFLAAFKRADELATAMEARGYRSASHRTVRPAPALTRQDMGSIFLSVLILALVIL